MPRLESPFLTTNEISHLSQHEPQVPSRSGFRIYYNQDRWKRQWLRGFLRKFDAVFTQIIPIEDVKDMPVRYKYGIGGAALLGLIGIFLALFITSYQRQKQQHFLAPLKSNSHQASSNCETILVSNTGQYMATEYGLWEGAVGFNYSQAAYSIYLTNWQESESEFAKDMNILYTNALIPIGQQMSKQNLGMNVLYWTSYNQIPGGVNLAQRFSPTGDPIVIFDREHVGGVISSVNGICNISSSITRFYPNEGKIYLQMNYEQYIHSFICNSSLPPYFAGYVPGMNSEIFEAKLDIRSLFTSMAVNLQILKFSEIVSIEGLSQWILLDGVNYFLSYYYDPKFPGMTPIACITTQNQQFCTIQVGSIYGVPFFHHAGNNTQFPQQCLCDELTEEDLSNDVHMCNMFQFLAGVLFWPSFTEQQLFEILVKYNYSFAALNNATYRAAFTSSIWGQQSIYHDHFNSPEYLSEIFEFCNLPLYGSCSMLTFSAFDTYVYDWAVSKYYYQLQYGACRASLTPTPENWQKLIDSPFSDLIQQYQKCSYSSEYSLFTQFGASVGNLSVATPIFIILFLTFLAVLKRSFGLHIPTIAYHKDEKDAAIEALAIALLRERDRQRFGNNADSQYSTSLTKKLVEELSKDTATYKLTGIERCEIQSPIQPREVSIELSEKVSTQLIVLNKTVVNSIHIDGLLSIDNFSEWWFNATIDDRIVFLTSFHEYIQNIYSDRFGVPSETSSIQSAVTSSSTAQTDSQYWSIVRDSGVFALISWTSVLLNSSKCSLIVDIVIYHACLQMNIANKTKCLQVYGSKLGYRFSEGIKSLKEMEASLIVDPSNNV